jgi:hypothetical protein
VSARRVLVTALAATALSLPAPALASAGFGFLPGSEGFGIAATKAGGVSATAAGSHPYAFEATVGLNASGGESDGDLRTLRISLPPGFLVNPTAVTECLDVNFHTPRTSPHEASASGESCSSASQVGTIEVAVGGTTRWFGLFNLTPSFGSPVAIGASPFGTPLVFTGRVREGDVGFDLSLDNLPQSFDLRAMTMTIWGTPWEGGDPKQGGTPGHNPQRGNCLNEQTGGSWGECLVFDFAPAPDSLIKSYLTLPTIPCGQPLSYAAVATSWQGGNDSAGAITPALSACNKSLATLKAQLMTDAAASRTGLALNLAVNDGGGILNPGGIARPPIKTAIASLPEGLTINPSLGAGLGVCEEADFARETAASEPGAGCPNDSKIGEVTVEGPLGLPEPLQGSIYLATPHANPFGTLLAVHMLARSARRGLIVKSQGKIEPDPQTGRLVATFENLPRLLYTHFTLTLREGQRSTLVSPPACGAYQAGIDIASWAEPSLFKHDSSTFAINRGEGGGPCPSGGVPPFAPGLLAGSINPAAGAYTPFYMRMTRADGEQEITSYSATFPPGLLAKLAGVTECPEAALAAAAGRSGTEEQANPSCPVSSSIGRTMAGFGVGGVLAWAPGGLYLAGPYHGAPLSVVAIDAAVIGPFDLGTVVVRQAIRIDRRSAQVSIDASGSDPIPHILAGIPLHLSDIRVYVDRPGFTVNPTSCDPMRVTSNLGGAGADPFDPADDSLAASIQRYQVINCRVLGFKPALSLRLRGSRKHGGYPALRAAYKPRAKDANLSAVSVTLPPSIFLAQEHIDTVCSRVQFNAGGCPKGSVYGRARAVTPLLEEPLQGPVYLRSSRTAVPDLVADLRGRGIEIEVPGRIDTSRGGLRANFESLPDAPVTRFTMTLFGGRRGLLANAENPCRGTHRANARFIAQSNETAIGHPRLKVKCKGKRKSPPPKAR